MKDKTTICHHPNAIVDAMLDEYAQQKVQSMSPRELGLMLYPNATPVYMGEVPPDVVIEHLDRYTQSDLEAGQFLEVLPGKFTFIMSHETKKRKESEQVSARYRR